MLLLIVRSAQAQLPELTAFQIKTLQSVREIDEFPAYLMHYYGDYHFDDFLKKGLEGQPKAGVYIQNEHNVSFL